MTTDRVPNSQSPPTPTPMQTHHPDHGHGGHPWMMIACCIPMLILAVVLVATGVAGAGALFAAIACTVMMALMMGGMSHSGGDDLPR